MNVDIKKDARVISVQCDNCKAKYSLDETKFKKDCLKGRCKKCKSVIVLLKTEAGWSASAEKRAGMAAMKTCPKCESQYSESTGCVKCCASAKEDVEEAKEPSGKTDSVKSITPEGAKSKSETVYSTSSKEQDEQKDNLRNENLPEDKESDSSPPQKSTKLFKYLYGVLAVSFLFSGINSLGCLVFLTIGIPAFLLYLERRGQLPDIKTEKRLLYHLVGISVISVFFLAATPFFFLFGLSSLVTSGVLLVSYLSFFKTSNEFVTTRKTVDIERGVPVEFLDIIGNLVSIQSKILFLNANIDSHNISERNEKFINEFIKFHKLFDVKVRLNQFSPQGEIKRLFQKNHMNIVFRLVFGPLLILAYILNPGRLFGGDNYNPTTNTVNIYSNHPAIILHELGHALDNRRRRYPGVYMFLRLVPFVGLYQEYKATMYALEFLREKGYQYEELEGYKVLFPAYSTYVFGAVFEYFPSPLIVWLFTPFIIIGHIIGRVALSRRKKVIEKEGLEIQKPEDATLVSKSMNWMALFSILPGFLIGLYLFQIWGAVIGSVACYFAYKEFSKYRENAEKLKVRGDGNGTIPVAEDGTCDT